ncbi:ankyrin repeat domain-containing protein [Deinococcus enclensis]|uniref:Ankyrin repeat protein n=1 Tax=Deinococcus enclensis TaxID=1049582 RepID=A0ABT9MEI4_9DEIO|nr:ankyrin repeat domain-containing protein [Deinococcus enclensis]MDP9764972.1 ankyrin repeat protein [Deinococcus enclensis]
MEDLLNHLRTGNLDAALASVRAHPSLLHARPAQGPSPLLTSVYYGHAELGRALVAEGAVPDLFEASALGLPDHVQAHLDAHPDSVNAYGADGFQPLGLACFFGHAAVAGLLLARGADVNSPSRNAQQVRPLHSAVAGGHLEISRALLDHGADVNAVQEGRFTPLHSAAQNGQPQMVTLLLNAGADPAARTAEGLTPADHARRAGYETLALDLDARAR